MCVVWGWDWRREESGRGWFSSVSSSWSRYCWCTRLLRHSVCRSMPLLTSERHGAAVVDDELAAQVCFFFKPFDK